jgi:hypothetical protein
MPAAYSITCPSCGSAFLATQTRPTSITTCPHCAYNAPLQAFQAGGVTTIGPATALPLRRRDPRTHYQQLPLPTPQPPPPPHPTPPHPTPPHPLTPPPTPDAHPSPPHPLTPPSLTPPAPPFNPPPLTPASAPPTPIFPELPVFTTSPFSNPPPSPPPTPPPTPPQLPPILPARPPHPPPDSFLPQAEFATLSQSAQKPAASPFWHTRFGLLIFLIITGSAAALLWHNRSIENIPLETTLIEEVRPAHPLPTSPETLPSPITPTSPPETSTPPTSTVPPPPEPDPIAAAILSERVLTEGSDLFRQILLNPDSCLAHVDQFAKHRAQITAFFERHPKIVAEDFQKVPVAPRDLQSGLPVQMLQVTTSASPEAGALLRFRISPDDRLLLDWPLFEETHEGALAQFIESKTETQSQWFSVGLRRNHGLDLDESARNLHHAFDIQSASKSLLGMPGIVVRDLPVGRFLDQKTEWRVIHMARLLLRSRTLDSGLKCVEIIDCEGLGLAQSHP